MSKYKITIEELNPKVEDKYDRWDGIYEQTIETDGQSIQHIIRTVNDSQVVYPLDPKGQLVPQETK